MTAPRSLSSPPHAAAPALEIEGLSVRYGNVSALRDASLTLQGPELAAIVGPNGAGKSTLLKAAVGLISAESGYVRFFGRALAEARKDIAYIPQRSSVDWDFPANALDVVVMGLYARTGWFRPVTRAHRARALECLERVGLRDFARRQIGALSGGQQQRVFLARALAQDARLYLMDEPFAGVDTTSEESILGVLHGLKRDGRTILCVHHDLDTVRRSFDRAILMNGRIVADGPPDAVLTPDRVAEAYRGTAMHGTTGP